MLTLEFLAEETKHPFGSDSQKQNTECYTNSQLFMWFTSTTVLVNALKITLVLYIVNLITLCRVYSTLLGIIITYFS